MTNATEATLLAMLGELAVRNGSLELTFAPIDDQDTPPQARTRLFKATDRGYIIERPVGLEWTPRLKPGNEAHLSLIEGTHRWAFEARVLGSLKFRLNDQTEVEAVALGPAMNAHDAQRRTFFRVSCVGLGLSSALLTPLPEAELTEPAASEMEMKPQPFETVLLNLGGGGVGVLAPQRVAGQLPECSRYRCTLRLPTQDKPLVVVASVVRIEPREDGTTYLGMAFEFDREQARRNCEDELCRFAAWHQRQELQRRRERK